MATSKIQTDLVIVDLPQITPNDKGVININSYLPSGAIIVSAWHDGFYNIIFRRYNGSWTIGVYDFDWQVAVKNTAVNGVHLVCKIVGGG